MRRRLGFAIVGIFLPFVMGSQTFGTTQLRAFDTDFLEAPLSPVPVQDPMPENPNVSWQSLWDPTQQVSSEPPLVGWEDLVS